MEKLRKILFVGYTNRSRSPMAEYFLNDTLAELMMDRQFKAESAGTQQGLISQPVFFPAKRRLEEFGIDCSAHEARELVREDYDIYEWIICMDELTANDARRITEEENGLSEDKRKIHKLLDFTYRKGEDISDPMITSDYDTAWRDIIYGCRGLMEHLLDKADRYLR